MKFVLDTHTHTLASGHAYNTIHEMAQSAKSKTMELLCITEHGPKMPGACCSFYFMNLHVVKRVKFGVELMLGIEANIIDYDGSIDLDSNLLKNMDLCIASLHIPCIKPGTMEQNTNAYIEAMQNPYVHILGHPDDNRYAINYDKVIQAAKKYHVAVELNNNSLDPDSFRKDSEQNELEILRLCKKYEVCITLGSDAHTEDSIGDFYFVEKLIHQIQFPEELILNTSKEKFKKFIDFKRTTC